MENKLARFISYLFHPLLMPFYFFLILFFSNTPLARLYVLKGKLVILSFVFITTCLLPAIMIYILYIRKTISSIHLEKREERPLPYLLTVIFYYLAFYLLKKMNLPTMYYLVVLATALLIILLLLVNFKFKISAHTASSGGLLGLLCGMSIRFGFDFMLYIIGTIMTGGLVGFARLQLSTHTQKEVYTGYFTGFAFMLLLFLVL